MIDSFMSFSRVVLMSATADISRYREYFRDLGRDERVEVLAIPSTEMNTIFQRQVLYLEQVLHATRVSCFSCYGSFMIPEYCYFSCSLLFTPLTA